MNILFLSIYEIQDSNSGYIYADLIREFAKHNHTIYAVTPTRVSETECFVDKNNVNIVKIKNGQIQKTSKIKKAVNLFSLERNTIKAIKKYAPVKFDLIVSMSSSLSYAKTSLYFKKRDNAVNFLLIKDIFPQNAVDLGMLRLKGFMGLVYRYFRKKERKMYRSADYIGCMSAANRDYIIQHNKEIKQDKVLIVPNSFEPQKIVLTEEERTAMREKYGIPQDKIVFVYGGNLGKPQNVPFIIECLKTQENNDNIFFLIVGDGTEYAKFEAFLKETDQQNVKVLQRLPRSDFDKMLAACDIGLIFLDHRFTVPNYPSRFLSYLQAGLPVFACTDLSTDIGKDIISGKIGWWCESRDVYNFTQTIKRIEQTNCEDSLKSSEDYLKQHFTTEISYNIILGNTKV